MRDSFRFVSFGLVVFIGTMTQGCSGGSTSKQANFAANTTQNVNSAQPTLDTESTTTAAKCTVDKPFLLPGGCKLPFNGRTGLDVDQHCPIEGCAKSEGSHAQDLQKNNLCAIGKPIELSFGSFDSLQSAVDDHKRFDYEGTGKKQPGPDRSGLKNVPTVDVNGKGINLSEGDVVTLTGIVKEAKHDDVPLLNPKYHGEGVNCNNDDVEWNDIHIVLLEAGDDECQSVTAEIIPHFRPALWDRFDSNPKTSSAVNGLPVTGIKVRLTGQLFFDGSHAPCTNQFKSSSDPARRASWEIHPIYKIEVFDGGKFAPFETWASKH